MPPKSDQVQKIRRAKLLHSNQVQIMNKLIKANIKRYWSTRQCAWRL